jgi:hypothetical protein
MDCSSSRTAATVCKRPRPAEDDQGFSSKRLAFSLDSDLETTLDASECSTAESSLSGTFDKGAVGLDGLEVSFGCSPSLGDLLSPTDTRGSAERVAHCDTPPTLVVPRVRATAGCFVPSPTAESTPSGIRWRPPRLSFQFVSLRSRFVHGVQGDPRKPARIAHRSDATPSPDTDLGELFV